MQNNLDSNSNELYNESATLKGRIVKGVGGKYTVICDGKAYVCGVRGIFRKRGVNPTIGDFVTIGEINDANVKQTEATIVEIEERKNFLIRPRVSNVDVAALVFSVAEPALNVELLDNFIIAVEYENIEPLLCFNKIDILSDNFKAEFDNLCQIYVNAGYSVVCCSSETKDGLQPLRDALNGKVSVFAGPSGVGKSSIINLLMDNDHMEIGELSQKIKRGKHTTRHAELMQLNANSFIVDSPGFTTLDLTHIQKEDLARLFREFRPFIDSCKFNDCKHINEPFCAVKEHVGAEISTSRYEKYKKVATGGF